MGRQAAARAGLLAQQAHRGWPRRLLEASPTRLAHEYSVQCDIP